MQKYGTQVWDMNRLRSVCPGASFADCIWYILDGYRKEHPGERFERRPNISFEDAMRYCQYGHRMNNPKPKVAHRNDGDNDRDDRTDRDNDCDDRVGRGNDCDDRTDRDNDCDDRRKGRY